MTTMEVPQAASAGRTTPAGGVVVAATLGDETLPGSEPTKAFLVRDPGGQFRAVVPPEEIMEEGEELFEYTGVNQPSSLQFAAVEEASGKTGAFVVPHVTAIPNSVVLHYDGVEWSREPICLGTEAECEMSPVPAKALPVAGFKVIAIAAADPENAWLLATVPRKSFNSRQKHPPAPRRLGNGGRRGWAGRWGKSTNPSVQNR